MPSKGKENGFIEFDPDLPDEDKGISLFILCVLFSVLIIVSTVSRVAMKLITRLGLSASDYLMIITLVKANHPLCPPPTLSNRPISQADPH
jgi:hypothetical protein